MTQHLFNSQLCWDEAQAYWVRQAVLAHAAAVRFTLPAYTDSAVSDVRPFTYGFYNSLVAPGRSTRVNTKAPNNKIICVSAMKDKNKNGMEAVRAFSNFAAGQPEWSLYLYGKNRYRAALQNLSEKFPRAAIFDCGTVDDVDQIYSDAYALIIPSYEEGLPNVVIEAFSYGVPCIGFSDCEGVKHLIKHEENGLLADRTDPESLQKALRRMADPELRQFLSANAKRFADENLGFETWEANWLYMVQNAANWLNNKGQPQIPVACDETHPSSVHWSGLLQTFLGYHGLFPVEAPLYGRRLAEASRQP